MLVFTSLSVEGNTINEDEDKANALNKQFQSVFTVEGTSVMPTLSQVNHFQIWTALK